MLDDYLNKDAQDLFNLFQSDFDREWAWKVIESLRERYPDTDQWTTGGPNYSYTDLRFGKRNIGQTARRVSFLIRMHAERPECRLAKWLSKGFSKPPSINPATHPDADSINSWLDEFSSLLEQHSGDLTGGGYKPVDYGASAPPVMELGDDVGDQDDVRLPAKPTHGSLAESKPLNTILYGPPGTGKTYATIDEALSILDPEYFGRFQESDNQTLEKRQSNRSALKARFDELAQTGRVRFVTFHQSFSYEDFVEGIRALPGEDGRLNYQVDDGVFKELCVRANEVSGAGQASAAVDAPVKLSGRRIWKMSLGSADNEPQVYQDCIKGEMVLLGYGYSLDFAGCSNRAAITAKIVAHGKESDTNDYAATAVNQFVNVMKPGDLVVVTEGNLKFRAIGEVTGPYRFIERDADWYRQSRPVRWLRVYETSLGFSELMNNRFSQMTLYQLRGDAIDMAKLAALLAPAPKQNVSEPVPYVLVIDEINRGNVSRIFGELITLIEPSKRARSPEALSVTLPYSKRSFSVPSNVYLLGTMNTADRSLAGLDIALRRRFTFKEMPPRPELLSDVDVSGVNVGQLLSVMNERIELLLDRDHLLGHAYFMPLTLKNENTLEALERIFRNQILPLLQEYFFDDWERIVWVLNDHRKPVEYRFVRQRGAPMEDLFGVEKAGAIRDSRWEVNAHAFAQIESYARIVKTA